MYLQGNVLLVEGSFRNEAGKLFDPTNITFHYEGPDNNVGFYDDQEFERLRTGRYQAAIELITPGLWVFQWRCDGPATGVGEIKVRVEPREIE